MACLGSLPAFVTPLLLSGGKVAVVDNTSSSEVASLYPLFLSGGLSVVTPNKKAYSSSLELYESIVSAPKSPNAKFLNEATVGAGLPVIGTLKDLVMTGDRVSLYLLPPYFLAFPPGLSVAFSSHPLSPYR